MASRRRVRPLAPDLRASPPAAPGLHLRVEAPPRAVPGVADG